MDARQAKQAFIDIWGEMALSWGVSKSMTQIYAVLYVEAEPLSSDDIMARLAISRGNVNINLHKLLDWGLVHKVYQKGSRKTWFEAEKDIWQLTTKLIEARQNRELTPLSGRLEELAQAVEPNPGNPDEAEQFRRRMTDMARFIRHFDDWTQYLLPLLRTHNPQFVDSVLSSISVAGKPQQ
jgi:DNA-binding transcriptional regulator GbsR (MarR family)